MASRRPTFHSAWNAFMVVQLPVRAVGAKIGGHVEKNVNIDPKYGGFANACPIRMSYVLNHTGFPISKSHSYKTVSGADGRQYMFQLSEMRQYLETTFGKPDKMVKSPKPSDFIGMKGIIAVVGHGWGNAKGHVTLWNGVRCSDTCHLLNDPENGPFVPETASIWLLP